MSTFDADRKNYHWLLAMNTRWMDNDIYGHVNNVVYYSYFDTIANQYLIEQGGLDIHSASIVGYVVASACQYLSPVSYPEPLEGAFRVNQLGNSSVEYGIAIFGKDSDSASAHGTFTHVFVDRSKNRPVPIPDQLRIALQAALIIR